MKLANFTKLPSHVLTPFLQGCFRSLDSTSAAELFSGGATRSCSPSQWQNVVKDSKGRFIWIYQIWRITKPTCRAPLHLGRGWWKHPCLCLQPLFEWSWRPKELQLFPFDRCLPPVRCTWIDTWQYKTWSWEVGLKNEGFSKNLFKRIRWLTRE